MFSKIVNRVCVSFAAVLVVGAMVVASADTARAQDSANKQAANVVTSQAAYGQPSNNNYPQPMTGAGFTQTGQHGYGHGGGNGMFCPTMGGMSHGGGMTGNMNHGGGMMGNMGHGGGMMGGWNRY